MATTTNYGWTTPDDTALVKDGASAIRTLGSSIDTTTKNLNPSTTLGDIEYRSSTANTNTRLGIGSTGQVLTVSGGVPSWAAAPSSSGPACYVEVGSTQSITSATDTKIALSNEIFDTDNCFNTTTYRFTPTKAGKYQVSAGWRVTGAAPGYGQLQVQKNGAFYQYLIIEPSMAQSGTTNGNSILIDMNGTTDYLEMWAYSAFGSPNLSAGMTWFSAAWIRS